jgi:hypothetical protein
MGKLEDSHRESVMEAHGQIQRAQGFSEVLLRTCSIKTFCDQGCLPLIRELCTNSETMYRDDSEQNNTDRHMLCAFFSGKM